MARAARSEGIAEISTPMGRRASFLEHIGKHAEDMTVIDAENAEVEGHMRRPVTMRTWDKPMTR